MVTLAVVAPIARYRHAHTSNHVLPRPRGRWTSPPTARAAAGRPVYPLLLGLQPREGLSGVGIQRRDAHQPDELQALGGLRVAHSSSTRSGRPISTPPRSMSPSRLIWM